MKVDIVFIGKKLAKNELIAKLKSLKRNERLPSKGSMIPERFVIIIADGEIVDIVGYENNEPTAWGYRIGYFWTNKIIDIIIEALNRT